MANTESGGFSPVGFRAQHAQVYLLLQMDRATLPRTKSTISRGTPNVITKQQVLRATFKAHCYPDRQLCRLLDHTYAVRPKLILVDMLSMHYTLLLIIIINALCIITVRAIV